MRFHCQHGDHIVLEEEYTKATRVHSFCNGVVFSREPITLEAYYNVTVTRGAGDLWSGSLSVGLTGHDPDTMTTIPTYVSPHLTTQTGFWAAFVSEEHLKNHHRLTFYVNKSGEMRFVVEEAEETTVLTNLPTTERLWLMIDVYGTSTAVKFNQENDVPQEIYAKGPEAVHNFNVAMNDGSIPAFRTRLMLIGNDPTARSLLKRHLINQHDVAAKTTSIDGLEISGYHIMEPTIERTPSGVERNEVTEELVTSSQSVMVITFYQILATNISRSILVEKKTAKIKDSKDQPEVRKKFKSARLERQTLPKRGTTNNGIYASRKRTLPQGPIGPTVEHKEEMYGQYLNELPDDVSATVKIILQETESKQSLDMEDSEKFFNVDQSMNSSENDNAPSSIAYHVWDLNTRRLHYDLLQLVLSPRAVYIVIFDLDSDLDSPSRINSNEKSVNLMADETPPSQLEEILFWMNCIHAYATPSVVSHKEKINFLSPPIIIVGTYRRKVDDQDGADHEKKIEEKFLRIQDCVLDKPFCDHVIRPFFALDISEQQEAEMEEAADNNTWHDSQNEIIVQLQNKIRDMVARQMSYGEEMSTKWLRFENAIVKLRENGFCYAELAQVQEIARTEGIETESGQKALISFYHDIGLLMHFNGVIGTQDWSLAQWVILDPLWLVNVFNKILTFEQFTEESIESCMLYLHTKNDVVHHDKQVQFHQSGILGMKIIQQACSELMDHETPLLEAMVKLDLLCQKNNYPRGLELLRGATEQYYLPCKVTSSIPNDATSEPFPNVTMYFDFLGFLPDGLFHRLIVRTIQWTQGLGGRGPLLYRRAAKFHLDDAVDFQLHMHTSGVAYVKVTIVLSNWGTSPSSNQFSIPPYACAKIRNFIESTLADLREMWMKRMSYRTCVRCPCDRVCNDHQQKECRNEACKHFLLLDDCLANNVVLCDYRRVNTSFIRKRFPRTTVPGYSVPVLPENVVMKTVNNETIIMEGMGLVLYQRPNANDVIHLDPRVASGFRMLAKILNGAGEGHNWAALAHSLGYRQSKIDDFREDLNPGLALITDWIFSSGNTCLSMDMLISCLKNLESHQAIDILQEMQDERDETPVFISYQWDVQDEVVLIRNKLEQYGLDCWMDIGQMGGGDLLYNRIYRGISRAKVVLTCITPKYVVAHNCTREISLADLLGKPVIPIMIHPTPWPPPGPLALLFSQLIYVDMCGIGGHGGTGYHADWEDRFQEILSQISKFVAPVYHKMMPSPRSGTTTTVASLAPVTDNVYSRTASLQNFITLDSTSFQSMGHMESQTLGEDLISTVGTTGNGSNDESRIADEYRRLMAAAMVAAEDENATEITADSEMDVNGDSDMATEDLDPSAANPMQAHVVKCSICLIL